MMGGLGGFGFGGACSVPLLLMALLAAAVWVIIKLPSGRGVEAARTEGEVDPAEKLLRERFARSEISAEEYRQAPCGPFGHRRITKAARACRGVAAGEALQRPGFVGESASVC